MSTVIGALEMFPKFDTMPASVEEALTLLNQFVEKFLSVADFLEIKKEETHTYGKFVYLGEKGKGFPIMAIGNMDNASYYSKALIISRIGTDGNVMTRYYANVSVSYVGNITIPFSKSDILNMKYVKTSRGMAWGFYLGTETPHIKAILSPMQTVGVEGEYINFAMTYNGNLYVSCLPHSTYLSNGDDKIPSSTGVMIPSGKRALADVYMPYDNSFPYLKLFSTYYTALKKFEVEGKKYVQLSGDSGYWSIVMEIE